MMRYLYLCLLLVLTSCISSPLKTDRKFYDAWQEFSHAASQRDNSKLISLTSDHVYCPVCLENTDEKKRNFEDFKLREPDSWYDTAYQQLSYIDKAVFTNEDIAIIFEDQTLAQMQNEKKIVFNDYNSCGNAKSDIENPKYKEVFINMQGQPTIQGGIQKIFSFVEAKDGYKLCGYSTVP